MVGRGCEMNEMIPFEKLAAEWRKDPDFMRE